MYLLVEMCALQAKEQLLTDTLDSIDRHRQLQDSHASAR